MNRYHPSQPSAYSYRNEIQRQIDARRSSETVFRALAYSTIENDNEERDYLVGGSNFGVVCIWKKRENSLNITDSGCISYADTPVFRFEVTGSISKMMFCSSPIGKMLVLSTFQGSLMIYKWNDIVERINQPQISTLLNDLEPIRKIRTSSVNSFSIHVQDDGIIIVTAGVDGLKQWTISDLSCDISTLVPNVYDDTLSFQDVRCIGDKVYSCSIEGCMGVWDLISRTQLSTLGIKQSMNNSSSQIKTDSLELKFSGWKAEDEIVVKSIDVDNSATWLVCCGYGRTKCGTNGFICVFHLPTEMMTASYLSNEKLEAIAYHRGLDNIVTVSDSGLVSFWNRSMLYRHHSSQTSSRSGFTLSIDPSDFNLSVGGSSPNIDCFVHRIKSYSVTVN